MPHMHAYVRMAQVSRLLLTLSVRSEASSPHHVT